MASRLYRDAAIVLRTYRLGESDRIVVFLTENHGKVRAVAKGIRKTRSRFGGRLEPLSHVNVQFHRGTNLDVVSQVETIDASTGLYGDLDVMTEASAVLEAVDRLVPDLEPVPQTFRMLVGVRRTLIDKPSPLVVPAFLWKLLAAEGVRPELDRCVGCGAAESADAPFVAFDSVRGGVQCRSCRTGGTISAGGLALLRDMLGGRLGAVLDAAYEPGGQRLGDPVVNEVAELATRAFEAHVERRLRSLGIFERSDGG
ncbi:MAG: repair protein RecO [Actinomycetota bacterium]|jgi:DNA repair protein RecO (recombination protein O)